MARPKSVPVREKADPRAIPARRPTGERPVPRSLQNKFHTINIAEQDGELPYVDVFISGTVPDAKNEQQPFARNYQIQRGMDVMNVPAIVVHAIMDNAVETRYRQEVREQKDGTKRNVFIPFKKRSYPCTIVESYDEKKAVEDEMEFNDHGEDILIDEEA